MFNLDFNNVKKKIHVIIKLNGDSTIWTKISFYQLPNFKFKNLLELIINNLKLKINNFNDLRLFDKDGLEIFEEDLQFIKNDDTMYISRGEDFNHATYYSEYEIINILGQGGFGKVVLGKHKTNNDKVAIKIIKCQNLESNEDIKMIFNEVSILNTLNHQNIVKINNFFFKKQTLEAFIIMEFYEGGELLNRLQEKGKFDEIESRIIFKQIISAIHYCHQRQIIHRDLKLENILLESKDSNIIKIVDFGISGLYAGRKSEITKAGSLNYMAPECLKMRNIQASPKLDIYSMGCILYGLLFGNLPFNGKNEYDLKNKIINENPVFNKKEVSIEAIDLITQMLNKDPEKRIKMLEINSHPWVLGKKMDNSKMKLNNNKIIEEDDEIRLNRDSTKSIKTVKSKTFKKSKLNYKKK